MFKTYFLTALIFLLPNFAYAVDLSKGLLEVPENKDKMSSFLKNGTFLEITPPEIYPVPIVARAIGSSMGMDVKSDKQLYNAGDTVRITISFHNEGFASSLSYPSLVGKKYYYLWSGGNFFVDIYRFSDEVKDGEYQVASGMAFKENNISLFQNEKNSIDFRWQIPKNFKNGKYEIRVFPTTAEILFLGIPNVYRAHLKANIKVENKEDELKIGWKIGDLKLGDNPVRLKEKVLNLRADQEHTLSIPLENPTEEQVDVIVKKKLFGIYLPSSSPMNHEESEEFSIAPNESRMVEFKIDKEKVKGKSDAIAFISFSEKGLENSFSQKKYLDFPIAGYNGESIEVPLYFMGNVTYHLREIGVTTIENDTIFKKGANLTLFMEVERSDPYSYVISEAKRAREDNIKVELIAYDKYGKKIDEMGYDGPSWDRSAKLSKTLNFEKKYDYLRIVGTLSSKAKGVIQKKELEYFSQDFKNPSLYVKIKEICENNRLAITVIVIIILAILSVGMTTFLIKRRKPKTPFLK